MKGLLSLAVAIALTTSSISFAADSTAMKKSRKKRQCCPCKKEFEKVCDEKLDWNNVATCLSKHKDSVSAMCQKMVDPMLDMRKNCEADKEKFCKDHVKPKEVKKCMIDNKDSFSKNCQDSMDTLLKMKKEMKEEMAKKSHTKKKSGKMNKKAKKSLDSTPAVSTSEE